MCVIVLVKQGFSLKHEDARAMFSTNDDGAGFAYVDDTLKRVIVTKGFLVFEAFWDAYQKAATKFANDSPFLIHFRIATKGKIGETNCHPFVMGQGKAALAHNGSFWGGTKLDASSDTKEFVDDLETVLVNKDAFNPKTIELLERRLGWNKIVILYDDKSFVIINEKQGSWNPDKTLWVSNHLWVHRSNTATDYRRTPYQHSRHHSFYSGMIED